MPKQEAVEEEDKEAAAVHCDDDEALPDDAQHEEVAAECAAELREAARLREAAGALKARIAAAEAGTTAEDTEDVEALRAQLEAQVATLEGQIAAFDRSRVPASQANAASLLGHGGATGTAYVGYKQEVTQDDDDSDTEGSSDQDAADGRSHKRRRLDKVGTVALSTKAEPATQAHRAGELADFAAAEWAAFYAEGYELVEESVWDPGTLTPLGGS